MFKVRSKTYGTESEARAAASAIFDKTGKVVAITASQAARRQRMADRIKQHGQNLQRIFPTTAGMDPVALCKKLRRIENVANRAAVAYCNGEINSEQWEAYNKKTAAALDKILGFTAAQVPVFLNGPCGYTLKIDDGWCKDHRDTCPIHTDWGGYGIIAPEIDGN